MKHEKILNSVFKNYLALGLISISVAAVVADVRVDEVDDEISSSDVTDVAVDVMQDDMPNPLVIVDDDEPEIETKIMNENVYFSLHCTLIVILNES